jgi:hypothetical protein
MIAGFHELIQISVHVFHADMELLTEWVEKNIKSRDKMLMWWKGP